MIIGCPECETRFVVAPQAIGRDGRMVRCSRCSKTWFQEAPDEDHEIVPEKVIEGEEKTLSHKNEGSKPASGTGEKIKSNVPAVVKKKIIWRPYWLGYCCHSFSRGCSFSLLFPDAAGKQI